MSGRHVLPSASSPAAPISSELIDAHTDVARSIAARYRNRGIEREDLEQVALLGLVKAAQRFDPDTGHGFLAFAVPTIRGEIRRHFRDHGWTVRPPRRLQELQARVIRANEELLARLGHSPRPTEIAAFLDEPLEAVTEALSLDGCFTPASLDLPTGGREASLDDLLGGDDPALRTAEARIILEPAIRALPERERRIVHMRFYDEKSQSDIAAAVGLTQAQVSRILRRILEQLHARLTDPPAAA